MKSRKTHKTTHARTQSHTNTFTKNCCVSSQFLVSLLNSPEDMQTQKRNTLSTQTYRNKHTNKPIDLPIHTSTPPSHNYPSPPPHTHTYIHARMHTYKQPTTETHPTAHTRTNNHKTIN